MAVEAYINFNGNCREAVEFYASAFGTEKPQFMTFGDTPPNPEFALPEETKKFNHAHTAYHQWKHCYVF